MSNDSICQMLPFLLVASKSEWKFMPSYNMHYFQCSPCFAKGLASMSTNTKSGDWSTSDLNSLVYEISTKFSIDPSSLSNYFKTARFANRARRAFTTFGFEGKDYADRITSLRITILKVTKSNGIYSITGRQASILARAKAFPNGTHLMCLDLTHHATDISRVKWISADIKLFYDKLESLISDQLNSFLQI